MTTWHVYMEIAAAERSSDHELESMFQGSAHQIRASLAIMKAQGMEVIPCEGCDNRDKTGRCQGHDADTTAAHEAA